jgi:hypothetical protein
VVGLGFLAAPVARLLGRRRALLVGAAEVALVRLVVQVVPDPLARWLLAPVGWCCSCGSSPSGWSGTAGLAVAVALAQAATAVLLVLIVRRATDPGSGAATRLGPVAAAWAGGMGLFVLLVLAYYAAYDVVPPFGNGVLPALAALLLALAGGGRPADERTWPSDRPDRRIDYIWLSADLAASGFAATPGTASDHRGVAVTIR